MAHEPLEIREITDDKLRFLDLLLIGDEDTAMIDRYIGRGRLFAGFIDGKAVACCVTVAEGPGLVEVKNLAVAEQCRRRGVGHAMLNFAEMQYPDCEIQLGTGETPSTLRFYRNSGYSEVGRIKNFFTDNYPRPIVEEGGTLRDMIILRKPRRRDSGNS